MLMRLFQPVPRRTLATILVALAVAVVWPGLVEYVSTGNVEMHWSRAMLASLLVVFATMVGITALLSNLIALIQAQSVVGQLPRPPERIRPANLAGEAEPFRSESG